MPDDYVLAAGEMQERGVWVARIGVNGGAEVPHSRAASIMVFSWNSAWAGCRGHGACWISPREISPFAFGGVEAVALGQEMFERAALRVEDFSGRAVAHAEFCFCGVAMGAFAGCIRSSRCDFRSVMRALK